MALDLHLHAQVTLRGGTPTTQSREALLKIALLKATASMLPVAALFPQASKAVLHPVLSERCGADGALLAQHGWREHTDMSDEVDAILGQLLQDQSAQGEGGEEEGDEAAEWRQALVQRMSRLEQASAGLAVWCSTLSSCSCLQCTACHQQPTAKANAHMQSFIAHQLEEESSVLPRLTTCLPGACLLFYVASEYSKNSTGGAAWCPLGPGPVIPGPAGMGAHQRPTLLRCRGRAARAGRRLLSRQAFRPGAAAEGIR